MNTPAVICGAEAHECRCLLDLGHYGPHKCDLQQCGGAWTGDIDGGDFTPVQWPGLGAKDPS